MATRWNVLVSALEASTAQPEAVVRQLESIWRSSTPAAFTVLPAAELAAAEFRTVDAVVLLADRGASQSVVLPLLENLEEAGVPVLALLDARPDEGNPFEYAAALVGLRDDPAEQWGALLHGLLHRTPEVKRLRAEVALNQRFHGGLRGEIAKMHEELQLAALVQREFLPRDTPTIHGVDFAALWRPTNYVSGDIYDVVRLDEDHAGIFVADAVGHGVPAALMTMVICRSLITKEITGNSYRLVPPSEVLARLNAEMIRRQGRTTRFATAVYALVNCRERVMQLAGAGHPPPVRLLPNGASESLVTSGGLLGVFPDEEYEQIELALSVDDRLLFYTDGFEQAFPAEKAAGDALRKPTTQYRDEFNQLRCLPTAAEMIETINKRLDDQSGSLHQIDDLTLVCMHAGPLVMKRDDDDTDPCTALHKQTSAGRVRTDSPGGGLRLAS